MGIHEFKLKEKEVGSGSLWKDDDLLRAQVWTWLISFGILLFVYFYGKFRMHISDANNGLMILGILSDVIILLISSAVFIKKRKDWGMCLLVSSLAMIFACVGLTTYLSGISLWIIIPISIFVSMLIASSLGILGLEMDELEDYVGLPFRFIAQMILVGLQPLLFVV